MAPHSIVFGALVHTAVLKCFLLVGLGDVIYTVIKIIFQYLWNLATYLEILV
ncbi:uncharacterized protein METZ01_LOCUS7608 [marine metagenome]|uniref:Uncharacterized protein n=1 Tax=marine metagenome TaxID=408172 RepID=A0A381NKV6_9ZZZZ